ncbi:ASST-domain-containing protein [Pestalotiopsis sp. NC0098]|nr:ASST-domain-containing protein [Pestalotiopsis sp. NC0098]
MAISKGTAGIAALGCLIGVICAQTATTSARWPTQTFVTEPDFHPPQTAINHTDDSALTPGLVIFSQDGTYAPESVSLIMDRKGMGDIQDLSPFTLFGEKVLVSWSGTSDNVNGDSFGAVTVWNDSYEPIYNITLNDPQFEQLYGKYDSLLNQHEVYITSWGTFLGLVYDPVPANLSAVGGPEDGWIRDGVVVEIDIETNELLFVWRASDFIPIEDSYAPIENARSGFGNSSESGWDYVHLNSVAELNGNIVVSSRHTFQAIHIDRQTGGVKWILQGEGKNDFTIDAKAVYRWQHDIRIEPTAAGLMMHLHDNQNNYTPPYNTSSGLLARIDEDARHVHFVRRYADPNDAVSVSSGGSYQPQPNGNVVVCHASQPVIKEYAEDGGGPLWSFRFGPAGYATGPGIGAYRAFVAEWSGYPKTKPKVAACRTADGDLTVFMSWNGATETAGWNVYSGADSFGLEAMATNVTKTGFETNVTMPTAQYVQVEALGGSRDLDQTQRSEVLNVTDVTLC